MTRCRLLHTLTSFETFDTLAGQDLSPDDVTETITGLAITRLADPNGDPDETATRHPQTG